MSRIFLRGGIGVYWSFGSCRIFTNFDVPAITTFRTSGCREYTIYGRLSRLRNFAFRGTFDFGSSRSIDWSCRRLRHHKPSPAEYNPTHSRHDKTAALSLGPPDISPHLTYYDKSPMKALDCGQSSQGSVSFLNGLSVLLPSICVPSPGGIMASLEAYSVGDAGFESLHWHVRFYCV